MGTNSWRRMLAFFLAFSLLAVACGGSDDDVASDSDESTSTDTASEDTGSEDAEPEPEADEPEPAADEPEPEPEFVEEVRAATSCLRPENVPTDDQRGGAVVARLRGSDPSYQRGRFVWLRSEHRWFPQVNACLAPLQRRVPACSHTSPTRGRNRRRRSLGQSLSSSTPKPGSTMAKTSPAPTSASASRPPRPTTRSSPCSPR